MSKKPLKLNIIQRKHTCMKFWILRMLKLKNVTEKFKAENYIAKKSKTKMLWGLI